MREKKDLVAMGKLKNQNKHTLGMYLNACTKLFGSTSSSAEYVKYVIDSAPKGQNTEVDINKSRVLEFLFKKT
jgi:hypothetical protein